MPSISTILLIMTSQGPPEKQTDSHWTGDTLCMDSSYYLVQVQFLCKKVCRANTIHMSGNIA